MTTTDNHDENKIQRKKQRTRIIQIIALVSCAVIIAAGVYFAIAYFTDKVQVNTAFTFGNVEIIPDEPDYPPDDPPDTPNEETPKNPRISNNGTETCIVFMEVKVPVASFTLVNEDGSRGEDKTTEVFWLQIENGAKDANSFNDINNGGDWVLLNHTPSTTDGEYTTYLFGYTVPLNGTNDRVDNVLNPTPDELAKLDKTEPLFDKVQIKNYLEGTLNGSYSIIVNSYGIQADYLLDSDGKTYLFGEDGTLGDTKLTETLLEKIWDIYGTQMS